MRQLSLFLCGSLLVLSGCQTVPKQPEPPVVVEVEKPACLAPEDSSYNPVLNKNPACGPVFPDNFSVRTSLSKAIALLGEGDVDDAQHQLGLVLIADPDNQNASDLLSQIHDDPVAYFGEGYFNYQVKRGDTMTTLSQRFLKNHLKFYLFSRYSGIDDPSSLVLGQIIKVPSKYKDAFEREERLARLLSESEALLREGRYEKLIKLVATASTKYKKHATLKLRLKQAYLAAADTEEQRENFEKALYFYKKLKKLSDKPELYNTKITQLHNAIESEHSLRLAKLYFKSGQLEAALKNVDESLMLNPSLKNAENLRQSIAAALKGKEVNVALDF